MNKLLQSQLQRIETLTQEIECEAPPQTRQKTQELIGLLLEYQREGISKILDLSCDPETTRRDYLERLVKDPLVNGLFILHGLHPVDLRTRVEDALNTVRPLLAEHSGNVQIVSENKGIIVLRLEGGCQGCPSSAVTLRDTIEKAVYEAVPDVIAIEVDGMISPPLGITPIAPPIAKYEEKEKCELCSQAITHTHNHLLNLSSQAILCSCKACSILFDQTSSENYINIPTEITSLNDFLLTEDQWDNLSVPVKLAFFYHSSALNKVRAYYPSPAGATESLLSLDAWDELVLKNPILSEFKADVETLLVDRTGSPARYFRVPLDESFKLVGIFRKHWSGFSGGDKVWIEVGRFFDELTAKAIS